MYMESERKKERESERERVKASVIACPCMHYLIVDGYTMIEVVLE